MTGEEVGDFADGGAEGGVQGLAIVAQPGFGGLRGIT